MQSNNRRIKILQLCAIDMTIKSLLLPLVDRLLEAGFEVISCASPGKISEELRERGYDICNIPVSRSISFVSNLISVFKLYRFIKSEKFDVVHVHTPVAGLLGRVAARLAGVPIVIYTAHGFYFHENMKRWKYKLFLNIEKFAGKWLTDYIFTQSEEDRITAVTEGIIDSKKISTIGNGVDVERKFNPKYIDLNIAMQKKQDLNIQDEDSVVAFIGRLVAEKGIVELLEAFTTLNNPNYKLLLIGGLDASERDTATYEYIKSIISSDSRIILTGSRYDVNDLLFFVDVFVLPSYREGMPRSIIEAMAMQKPVIASDIRGCREEVVDGVTGFIIPVKDVQALRDRIQLLLSNKKMTAQMGLNGRYRAEQHFNECKVIDMQIGLINDLIHKREGLAN